MTKPTLLERYYTRGLRAALGAADKRCLFEVVVELSEHPGADAVELTMLLQARSVRGLPNGSPAVLHRATLRLRTLHDGRRGHGWTWLPRSLEPRLARRCHFRLLPVKLNRKPAS